MAAPVVRYTSTMQTISARSPLRLTYDGAFDWPAMLGFLRARAIPGLEVATAGTYRRLISVAGDSGAIEVRQESPGQLRLDAYLPRRDGLSPPVERVRRMLSLDADTDGPRRHLRDDRIIGPLLAARPGLRVPGAWSPFEIGVRAIVGQQISVAGATTILGRITRRHGTMVSGLESMGLSHHFPDAGSLARADLSGIGLTTRRAATIGRFAEAVARADIRLDPGDSPETLRASLLAIKGIGPWTAGYIAMRLGDPDAMPPGDLGLRRAIESRPQGSQRSLEQLSQDWSPWRATAAIYLWTCAPLGADGPPHDADAAHQ